MTNRLQYRGKCKQLSEDAAQTDPTLTLTRGWYECPFDGKQEHWWTVRKDGSIFDPAKNSSCQEDCHNFI